MRGRATEKGRRQLRQTEHQAGRENTKMWRNRSRRGDSKEESKRVLKWKRVLVGGADIGFLL